MAQKSVKNTPLTESGGVVVDDEVGPIVTAVKINTPLKIES